MNFFLFQPDNQFVKFPFNTAYQRIKPGTGCFDCDIDSAVAVKISLDFPQRSTGFNPQADDKTAGGSVFFENVVIDSAGTAPGNIGNFKNGDAAGF